MLFSGNAFLGADMMSIPCAPTDFSDITGLTLSDCKPKLLYVTKSVTAPITKDFPDDWDYNTILYARFDRNSVNAGNVDWDIKKISHLLIKRRESGTFSWMTIHTAAVNSEEDFTIYGTDYTNAAKTAYDYAIVPSFYGIEGNYDYTSVFSDFEDVYLVSKNGVIHTSFTDEYCNMTLQIPSSAITTLNGRYPCIVRNTKANYYTGNFNGQFIEYNDSKGEYSIDDKSLNRYQDKILDFLSDGCPKLLKLSDSRIRLISIDSEIAVNADNHYKKRMISFNFQEIGNAASPEDLYHCGLSDVTEEWW